MRKIYGLEPSSWLLLGCFLCNNALQAAQPRDTRAMGLPTQVGKAVLKLLGLGQATVGTETARPPEAQPAPVVLVQQAPMQEVAAVPERAIRDGVAPRAAGVAVPVVTQRSGGVFTVAQERNADEAGVILQMARDEHRARLGRHGAHETKPGVPGADGLAAAMVAMSLDDGAGVGAAKEVIDGAIVGVGTVLGDELATEAHADGIVEQREAGMGAAVRADDGCCMVRCCGYLCCSAAGVRRGCGQIKRWCSSDDGKACRRKAAISGLAIAGTVVSLAVAKLLGARLSAIIEEYQMIKAGIGAMVGDVDVKGTYDGISGVLTAGAGAVQDDAGAAARKTPEAVLKARSNELLLMLLKSGVHIPADELEGVGAKIQAMIVANARKSGAVRGVGYEEKRPEQPAEDVARDFFTRVGLDVAIR